MPGIPRDGASHEARENGDSTPVALAVLPLGATEQHGPHLPTSTDTQIARAIAASAVIQMEKLQPGMTAELLPAQAIGASGEHAGFAGLVSIGTEVLHNVLVEIGRSVCEWAPRLLIVNAHGGNLAALSAAVDQLRNEGRDVAWVACETAADATDTHAGCGETSMMLAISPDEVDMGAAEPGCTEPIGELLSELRRGGVKAVSDNGVLGDPTGASAERGQGMLEDNARRIVAAVEVWQPNLRGRLSTG